MFMAGNENDLNIYISDYDIFGHVTSAFVCFALQEEKSHLF